MKTCGTALETKEVKNNILKTSVKPTAVYKIETPLKEQPFEVKYIIQPSLKKSYEAPKSSNDRTKQTVLIPNKEINNKILHTFANSNIKNIKYSNSNNDDFNSTKYINDKNNTEAFTNLKDIKYFNNNNVNTEKYINDKNNTQAFTNIKSNYTQIGSLEDFMDLSVVKTKDILFGNYNTNIRGNEKNEYIHDDIELSRVLPEYKTSTNTRGNDKIEYIHSDIELSRTLPEYKTSTNIRQNQEKRIQHDYIKELERNTPLTNMYVNSSKQGDYNISSREYQLNPKINAGGYEIPSQIPTQNRIGNISAPFQTEKSRLGKTVMQQFEGRYMH